jgi:hypothetical protein
VDAVVNLRIQSKGVGSIVSINNSEAMTVGGAQTVTGVKTFSGAPVISSFASSQHTHENAAGGGRLTAASFVPGSGVARLIYTATADSTPIANTTAQLAFDNSTPSAAMSDLAAVGSVWRFTFAGKFSTTGTPTLTLDLIEETEPLAFATTGAVTTPSGVTNEFWSATFILTTRAIGTSGEISTALPAPVVMGAVEKRVTATTEAVDFDVMGEAAVQISLMATWGTADPANTITCELAMVEALS